MSSTGPPAILVTGGSRGIGRAICLQFGQVNWCVGVHYRERAQEAHETVALITKDGGNAVICRADIRDPRQVHVMMESFVAQCGRIDMLVCNAGVTVDRLLLRMSLHEWTAILETNLTGTFHCLKEAGRYMLAQRRGSVVVISSFAAHHGRPGQSAYAASKAGLLGLVKTLAQEWGPRNVRINAILPGWHKTEMSEAALRDGGRFEDHALGRPTDVQAVARTVYHLSLLEDISGQIWNLDSRIL
jgi:3-oxoacyl-[acyl-carrier protein] reductase